MFRHAECIANTLCKYAFFFFFFRINPDILLQNRLQLLLSSGQINSISVVSYIIFTYNLSSQLHNSFI